METPQKSTNKEDLIKKKSAPVIVLLWVTRCLLFRVDIISIFKTLNIKVHSFTKVLFCESALFDLLHIKVID